MECYHAVSANGILWVHAGFWWYHGILVVHLQDSVGAFWAMKYRVTSICGLSVANVMTDGLSRVCSSWCIMLFLIAKILEYILWEINVKTCPQCQGKMVPWRRLVACYSCFMSYNVYVCLLFAAMCDNLHRDFPQPFVEFKSFRSHIFDLWCKITTQDSLGSLQRIL